MRLVEVLTGTYDAKRRVYMLPRTKTGGYFEVPITRRGAKLLPASFTVGANEASTLFSRLTRQLLLGDLTFHDTRATALTLLSRRVNVMTLARISRHKDLFLLLNVYTAKPPNRSAPASNPRVRVPPGRPRLPL